MYDLDVDKRTLKPVPLPPKPRRTTRRPRLEIVAYDPNNPEDRRRALGRLNLLTTSRDYSDNQEVQAEIEKIMDTFGVDENGKVTTDKGS